MHLASYFSDGTRTADYFNGTGAVTRVTFDVHHMGSQCNDDACFQALYEHMIEDYTEYVKSGAFTTEIVNWAHESVSYLPCGCKLQLLWYFQCL